MEQDKADSAEQHDNNDEVRRIRRLQIMMNMVMQVIAQDPKLTVEEASQMVADSRTAALGDVSGQGTGLRPAVPSTLPASDARTLPAAIRRGELERSRGV